MFNAQQFPKKLCATLRLSVFAVNMPMPQPSYKLIIH